MRNEHLNYPQWRNPCVPSVPVHVTWAETPKAKLKIYHILEAGEELRRGDEYWSPSTFSWKPFLSFRCIVLVGCCGVYRREVIEEPPKKDRADAALDAIVEILCYHAISDTLEDVYETVKRLHRAK